MKLLIDSDAFCKLGIAELLPDALEALEADFDECGRLYALPQMLRRGGLRKTYGAEPCERLLALAASLSAISDSSVDWLDRLTSIPDVDPGEALLFAAAAPGALTVVTGDKRALRGVKDVPGFDAAMAGRIVVLEALLICLCDRLGAEVVRGRVQPLMATDRTIRVCFSEAGTDPRGPLGSYFRELVAEGHPLILWEPPERGAP